MCCANWQRRKLKPNGAIEVRTSRKEARLLPTVVYHLFDRRPSSPSVFPRLERQASKPHTMAPSNVPTLYEWLGGIEALLRLTTRFYQRVPESPVLKPVFEHMGADHPAHVAAFLAEVLGGPQDYSAQHGGHPEMIRHHLNRHLTDEQRKAWLALLLDTADELRLPDDPEFRSALVGYLEWGTRLAVINSQPGAAVQVNAPMPKWGWGEVKGPYQPG